MEGLNSFTRPYVWKASASLNVILATSILDRVRFHWMYAPLDPGLHRDIHKHINPGPNDNNNKIIFLME